MNHDEQPRLNFMQHMPKLVNKLQALSAATTEHLASSLSLLVDIRASQMNGCAFCLDMHVKEAMLHNERALRLHHVAVWRESPLFTPKERAALAWTEALTRISPIGVAEDLYADTLDHFSEPELVALTFRVMNINAWNRLNVAFRTVPGSHDRALGLDKAGLA